MADAFTTDERVSLLFKKLLGKPYTTTAREFFQEPDIVSRSFVHQDDILATPIPASAPSDLRNLGDTDLDDNGRALRGSYAGRTSAIHSHIRYYHKVPLEFMVGTGGSSWQARNATTSHPGGFGDSAGTTAGNMGVTGTYGRVLQNSIPFNFAADGSYGVTMYRDTGVALPFGASGGQWLVDSRPGVVTFFQHGNLGGTVGESNPVTISFYRYVGPLGATTAAQLTETTNDFTTRQVFTGGTNGATDDQLSAIQIDNRDVTTLATNGLLDALQFGGNFDGSWRVCVQRVTGGSKLMIQAREGGVWVTKSSFSTP